MLAGGQDAGDPAAQTRRLLRHLCVRMTRQHGEPQRGESVCGCVCAASVAGVM